MRASKTEPKIASIDFSQDKHGLLLVKLRDGRRLVVPTRFFERLNRATLPQLANYTLTADGEGAHWPGIDEDISVRGFERHALVDGSDFDWYVHREKLERVQRDPHNIYTEAFKVALGAALARIETFEDERRTPLDLKRCVDCGEKWAEPIEFYRHVDHPKGKCTSTANGPPVRLLVHHFLEEVRGIRDHLLDATDHDLKLGSRLSITS